MIKLVNVSSLGSFSVHWTAESLNEYQLTNPHGTVTLYLSCRPAGRDNWATSRVVDPSRFGLTKPLSSFAEFRTIADEFVNGDPTDESEER